MELYAGIDSCDQELVWRKLRNQGTAMVVLGAGRLGAAIELRISEGNGRLPLSEIKGCLMGTFLLDCRLQLAFEIQPRDLAVYRANQSVVLGMKSGRLGVGYGPTGVVNSKR